VLHLAFDILSAAALIGGGLAVQFARGPSARRPPVVIPLIHGALGITGLALLLIVIRHGIPSTGTGTGNFGTVAAGFFCVALLLGLLIAIGSWRRGRPGGLLVATHASLAIAGVVLLLTLVSLG
jgi:LPXTG-motif cell wall-anchored protein